MVKELPHNELYSNYIGNSENAWWSCVLLAETSGQGKKLFNCHKFRTMTVKHNSSTVSVTGDSMITPLEAKLRHYKLDELPGLWDVLIGNMSFVGPRSALPGYADKMLASDMVAMGEKGYQFLKENYLVEHTYNQIMKHFK